GVLALNARIAARDGAPQDISSLANRLAQGGSNDAPLRIDVAATLLTGTVSKDSARLAYSILDGLVQTGTPPLEAIVLWASAGLQSGVDPAKTLTALESGSARAPHNTQLLACLANAHGMLGEGAEA